MEESVQGIPVGARRINITHMLSPAAFWARKSASDGLVNSIEEDMSNLFSKNKVQNYEPADNELVGVFDVRLGRWVRGRVEQCQVGGGEVFLVDYGRHLSDVETVRPLPTAAQILPPQAFQIFLYGVLPLTNCYDYTELKFKLMVSDSWMPAASSKVKQLLNKSCAMYFKCTQQWQQAPLGSVFLVFPNNQRAASLGSVLCDAEMASCDDELFGAELTKRVAPLMDAAAPVPVLDEEGCEEEVNITVKVTEVKGAFPLPGSGRGQRIHELMSMQELMERKKQLTTTTKVPGQNVESAVSLTQFENAEEEKKPQVQFLPAGQNIKPQSPKTSMLSQLTGAAVTDASRFIVNDQRLMKSPCPARSPDTIMITTVNKSPVVPAAVPKIPGNWPSHPAVIVAPPGPPRTRTDSQATPTFSSSTRSGSSVGGDWRPQLMEMTRQTQLPVLVRGCDLSKPLDGINTAPLHGDVHKALERLGCRGITNQQKHMWPAVLRGQNVISVGPHESGKTLGFVAPLASNMLDLGLYSELNKSNGPLVLVLCSNAEKACIADAWFRRLTRNDFKDWEFSHNHGFQELVPRVKVVLTYGGGAENEKLMELINGCQVLISTPPCLLRMLAYWENVVTDFDRLCHLVFDDADILFEKFNPQVTKILEMCKKSLGVSWRKERSLQIIATARCWTAAMEQFTQKVPPDPTVIVSTGLEVLAYCKIPPTIHTLTSSRCATVTNIVKQHVGVCKTVVVCCTNEEVLQLKQSLEPHVPNLLVVTEKMDRFAITRVVEKWTFGTVPGSLPLLVATDARLSEMELFDASLLVNFSMPVLKSVFSHRIACLLNQCPDNSEKNKQQRPKPAVHILLDDNDNNQIPALVELMKRLKAKIPDGLEAKGQEVTKQREKMKTDAPLCPNLRNFGSCLLQTTCMFRHAVVPELDESPPHIPRDGDVTLKALHVHSATHFTARLEQHTSPEGKTSSLLTKEHVYLPIDMSEFFEKQSNRKMVVVRVGTICAVEAGLNLFQRVRVERLLQCDRQGKLMVLVRSLDEGWVRFLRALLLLELPPRLQAPLPQAVDIHLCRMKPRDGDPAWSSAINNQVEQWLSEAKLNEADGYFLCGKIVLSVGGHLWLDPLECRQNLVTMGTPTIHFSVRSKLMAKSLALDNPSHLTVLYKMCREAGIQLPDYSRGLKRGVSRLENESLKADWAFLSSDELQEVNIYQVVTPSSFFVQKIKFQDNLEDLVDDICEYQNKQKRQAWKKAPTEPGSTVLAKYPADQVWHRALVERKEPSGEFLVFFVDYGDRAVVSFKDILPLPDKLLSKLPFQAIECSLAGVCPHNLTSWPESASDKLHQLSHLNDEQATLKALVAKVTGRASSTVTGGHRYAVRLYDPQSRTEVGEQLVASGEARFEPGWEFGEQKENLWEEVGRAAQSSKTEEENDEEEEEDLPFYQAEEVPAQEEDTGAASDLKVGETSLEGGEGGLVAGGGGYGAESFNIDANEDLMDDEEIEDEDVDSFLDSLLGSNRGLPTKEIELVRYMKSKLGEKVKEERKSESVTIEKLPPRSPIKYPEGCVPPLIKCAFTPVVVWSQEDTWVTLKVNLSAVKSYNLRVDASNIDFLTELEGRVYSFSVSLFGYVNPEMSTHAARGLYVEIKLYKLACFRWPRLERLILPPGHRTALDKQTLDSENKSSDDEELCKNWRTSDWAARHKAGSVAIPSSGEFIHAEGLNDLSDDEVMVDEGDNLNFLETFDPYNPLPG